MPVAIFGGIISVGIGLLGVFPQGGPRPYAFAWSALFLALGWNFLEYGFDPPAGGTSPGWLVCGFVFVLMGGVPLALLLWRSAARWAFWGPAADDPDTYLRPYRPPRRPGSPRAAMPTPTPTPTPSAAGGLVVPIDPGWRWPHRSRRPPERASDAPTGKMWSTGSSAWPTSTPKDCSTTRSTRR